MPLVTHPARTKIGANASIDPSARLTILDSEQAPDGHILLGDSVYLGRQVEITAAGGGAVQIGNDTSLQDGDIIYGDVRIGSHCLFGRQVFVASRGHNFREQPAWLIRDQDAAALARLPNAGPCTVIEDDCWIAQNVVVMPGVYIGRGAVLGANCVVTHDVGAYEVHGGVPNRKIGMRLDFRPPALLCATEDDCLPYFYRGFHLSQAALEQSRACGAIAAQGNACLVLAGAERGRLEVRGHMASGALRLCVNGSAQSVEVEGDFLIRADIPSPSDTRPEPLRGYTLVELTADGAFSVSAASVK
jgi:acetyltransferase-like isoleucine patch superfamily enzyme